MSRIGMLRQVSPEHSTVERVFVLRVHQHLLPHDHPRRGNEERNSGGDEICKVVREHRVGENDRCAEGTEVCEREGTSHHTLDRHHGTVDIRFATRAADLTQDKLCIAPMGERRVEKRVACGRVVCGRRVGKQVGSHQVGDVATCVVIDVFRVVATCGDDDHVSLRSVEEPVEKCFVLLAVAALEEDAVGGHEDGRLVENEVVLALRGVKHADDRVDFPHERVVLEERPHLVHVVHAIDVVFRLLGD